MTRRNLDLFFVIPVYVEKYPGYVDVAFIEFDESDHVRRSGMSTEYQNDGWPALAKRWLASQEPKKHER